MTFGPSQDSGPTSEAAKQELSSCQFREAPLESPVTDHSFLTSKLPNLAQVYSQEDLPQSVSPNTRVLVELKSHGISRVRMSEDVLDATRLPWLKFIVQLTALEARAHYAQLLDRQERKNQGIRGGDAGGLIDFPLNIIQNVSYCIGYTHKWLQTRDREQSTRSAQDFAEHAYSSTFQVYKGYLNYWLQATCMWFDARLDSTSILSSVSDPAAGTSWFNQRSRFYGFLSYIPTYGIQEALSFLRRDTDLQRLHLTERLEQEIRKTSLGSCLLDFVQSQGVPLNLRHDLPPLADGVTEFGDQESDAASISLNLFRSPVKLASVFIHEAMHYVDIKTIASRE